MAFGNNSKVFAFATLQLMSNGIKPSTDSYKFALYGNTITPDNTVTTAALTEWSSSGGTGQWCGATAGEVTGTGYTAGGVAITLSAPAQTTNVVTLTSATAPQWTSATINAYGGLVYDTTVSNEGLCYLSFSGSQSVTGGTFTVNFNASGIATFTC